MLRLGSPLVLLALALVQVPMFTCRHDCADDCVPLWAFVVSHCADEAVPGHHHHHCAAPGEQGCEAPHPDGDESHGPDDHDLVFAPVRSPELGAIPLLDPLARLPILGPCTVARVEAPEIVGVAPHDRRATGPPGVVALETVRLLL